MPSNTRDPLDDRIDRILAKLHDALLRRLAPFGTGSQPFRLEPVAKAEDVDAFEATYRVRLPIDYRRFITRAGDGGAGPAYGLLSLAKALAYDGEPATPARLQTPFPFNKYTDALHLRNSETDEYPPRSGSLTLCSEGVYVRHFLVLNGPARGKMWTDHTTADRGYWPLNVDFLTWYERWLDHTLAGGNGLWWSGYTPPGYKPK